MRRENKTIRESNKTIEWCFVFQAGERTPRIGVSADGVWFVESNDPVFVSEDPLGFLHCLELDYPALVSLLDERLSVLGLDPNLASSFPFEKACIVALPIPSMYWPDKALTWLTFFKPEDITPEILDGIEQLRACFFEHRAVRRRIDSMRNRPPFTPRQNEPSAGENRHGH